MLHLIAKPQKKKKGKKLLETIARRLNEAGIGHQFHFTHKKAEGAKIAGALCKEGERDFVVVGGDGCLNDVLTGLDRVEECTLGLIPAGTGNDFAAAANIPYGEKAIDLIIKGEAKPTDYINFSDGRRSMNIAGLGIDVDILTRCDNMKHFHARTKYFLSLLVSLIKFHGYEMRVKVNGEETSHNALICAVCNGKQLGGGIPLCPPAKIDDGVMDLMVVDNPKKRKLLGALIKLMRGKVTSLPFAHHIRCTQAEIIPDEPRVAQYDGELYTARTLAATLIAGGLRLYRP